MLTEIAPAKVNLFLHVGTVQENGRHPLDSLVFFAGPEASDRLTAEPAETLSLSISGPSSNGLDTGDRNLVLQAACALREAADETRGARLHLEKHLPIAAGIGGGSADAAAALRLLTRLWQLPPDLAKSVAPGLGGDVPVALHSQPALMQGEGERVLPVSNLPALPAVLVNPRVDCPTGPVFQEYDTHGGGKDFCAHERVSAAAGLTQFVSWLSEQRNDLEGPAIARVPEIRAVLDLLGAQQGARLVRMSGSGATCFAIFQTLDEAKLAERALNARCPDWWARATLLGAGI